MQSSFTFDIFREGNNAFIHVLKTAFFLVILKMSISFLEKSNLVILMHILLVKEMAEVARLLVYH